MRVNTRTVKRGPLSAITLGFLAAAITGGCSGTPETGTQVTESPVVQKNREESIKDAMQRGAYGGVKYDETGKMLKEETSKKGETSKK